MSQLLQDRVAVITGAGRGLGRAFALAMAREGAKILVNDLGCSVDGVGESHEPADEVAAEIMRMGGVAVSNHDSVATSAGANRIVENAMDRFGRIDILINNAGILSNSFIWEIPDEVWERMVQVNLNGTFYCTRAACLQMKKQGYGRIINNSSGAGMGVATEAAYAATKEAMIGLTRTVAKDMRAHGVTCNAIRPRAAATRFSHSPAIYEARKKTLNSEQFKEWQDMKASQTPERIAPLVVYLTSEHAGTVTGCVFDMLENYIAIYDDPPRFAKTIVNGRPEEWRAEDLLEVLPKTLLRDLSPQSPITLRRLNSDAKSWEWKDGILTQIAPQLR